MQQLLELTTKQSGLMGRKHLSCHLMEAKLITCTCKTHTHTQREDDLNTVPTAKGGQLCNCSSHFTPLSPPTLSASSTQAVSNMQQGLFERAARPSVSAKAWLEVAQTHQQQ